MNRKTLYIHVQVLCSFIQSRTKIIQFVQHVYQNLIAMKTLQVEHFASKLMHPQKSNSPVVNESLSPSQNKNPIKKDKKKKKK